MAASPNANADANQHDRFATPLDLHVYRPIARVFAALAEPTPVGPSAAIALGAVLGVAGASLLRYPSARQLVPGALLLVGYGVCDAVGEALAEHRGESAHRARAIASAVVGASCAIGAAIHVAATAGDTVLVVLAFGAVLLQGSLADAARRWSRDEGDDGAFDELLRRIFPGTPAGAAARPELDPLAKAWGYLGGPFHIILFAVFVCADAMLVYAWLRLVAGTLMAAALLFEQRRRLLALLPPAPILTHEHEPLASAATAAEKLAEEARALESAPSVRGAPISFRPPPPE